MATDNDNDDGDDELFGRFASFLDQREEAKRKEAERKKPPKDAAELIDRIADRVLDRAEERAEERRKAAEEVDDDDEPSRGESSPGFLKGLLGGAG